MISKYTVYAYVYAYKYMYIDYTYLGIYYIYIALSLSLSLFLTYGYRDRHHACGFCKCLFRILSVQTLMIFLVVLWLWIQLPFATFFTAR